MTVVSVPHDACARLADELCRRAIWSGERCTWLAAVESADLMGWRTPEVLRTIPGGLYDGSAGIALALAGAYRATGHALARRTALGAIEQSLRRLESGSELWTEGFYTGTAGVIYAALGVAEACREPTLVRRCRALVELARPSVVVDEFDVVSGTAGTALGLAAVLRRFPNDAEVRAVAKARVAALLERSAVDPFGLSWAPPEEEPAQPLTGFAHGTAGAAAALLAIWRLTGDARLRDAALLALQYEDSWFSATDANWADLRTVHRSARPPVDQRTHMTAWCHGAAGIAITRMMLERWVPARDREGLVSAGTPLGTTEASCVKTFGEERWSSLCHGLFGNAEIVSVAHRLGYPVSLAPQTEAIATAVRAVDNDVAELVRRPGLMLGAAGVLHTLTRGVCRDWPPVLLCGAELCLGRDPA